MTALIANVVGTGAALCSMSSFAPQLIKIVKERDATGVSLAMFIITAAGFALWCTYGFLLQAWPLVASNAVCLVLSSAIAIARLRFGDRNSPAAAAHRG